MNNQVSTYLSAHSSLSSATVYTLWGGANDIYMAVAYGQNGLTAESAAIANLKSQVTALANAGATTLLLFDLPDLSLTPYGRSLSAIAQTALHNASLQFNADWTTAIASLESTHPGLNIAGVDVYSLYTNISTNPSAYGFTNATTAAQGQSVNPDQYLFWDNLHPTTAADALIATLAYDDLLAIPEPSAVVLLIAGLLPIFLYRRVR